MPRRDAHAHVIPCYGRPLCAQTIITFVAPLVMAPIYAATEHTVPGLVFVVMSEWPLSPMGHSSQGLQLSLPFHAL
jgi:hypothetical protein